MSGILKNRKKQTESLATQTGSSMHFWGICCESGKQYAQVVGQRFRITMAVLDTNSKKEFNNEFVSLIVNRDEIEYLLCVLKHGEIHQVSLNLIFDKGENVKFYIKGHGKVYLSGYQLTDSEGDALNDENGYLCPLVEVKAKKKKMDSSMVSPNKQKKAKSEKSMLEKSATTSGSILDLLSQTKEEDDDDDEDDEDFSLGEEDTESEEEDSSDDDDDDEDEEDDDSEDEESEKEVEVNSHGSQKRKKKENAAIQKRSKNDSLNSSSKSLKNTEDVICIDNGTSDSDDIPSKNLSMSSIGHTPMPKKKVKEIDLQNVSTESKKSKKKKMNISDLSIKSDKEEKHITAESTPKNRKKIHPAVVKNGVEIQDMVIGRGPEALKGKMVHVFYVGRLENGSIFDSRLPGKKPFSFKLGAQQVIKGWEVGIEGMKVGGKRKLTIPPHMGYGKSSNEQIPGNSTLGFMVELQAVS